MWPLCCFWAGYYFHKLHNSRISVQKVYQAKKSSSFFSLAGLIPNKDNVSVCVCAHIHTYAQYKAIRKYILYMEMFLAPSRLVQIEEENVGDSKFSIIVDFQVVLQYHEMKNPLINLIHTCTPLSKCSIIFQGPLFLLYEYAWITITIPAKPVLKDKDFKTKILQYSKETISHSSLQRRSLCVLFVRVIKTFSLKCTHTECVQGDKSQK